MNSRANSFVISRVARLVAARLAEPQSDLTRVTGEGRPLCLGDGREPVSIHPRRLRSGRVSYDVKLRGPNGRQYTRTFRTRKEAENFQLQQRASLLDHSWIDPAAGNLSLGDYAAEWLACRPLLRPRTIELYEYLLRCHVLPALGAVPLRSLTTARIRQWHAGLLSEKQVSHSTAAKAYRLLRTIMSTAIEDELIARNPCVLKGAGAERAAERPIISVAQVSTLADSIDPRYRALVLLAVWAGLRFGEAAGLRRMDVDVAGRAVHVVRQLQELKDGSHVVGPPKSAAGIRTIALPPHMVADVAHHLDAFVGADPSSLVFTSPDGTPLRRSNFNRRVWQPACAAAGLVSFRFHDLRHTGNTFAASTGASTRELMARMGHSSPRAALIYQHATRDRDVVLAGALSKDRRRRPADDHDVAGRCGGAAAMFHRCSIDAGFRLARGSWRVHHACSGAVSCPWRRGDSNPRPPACKAGALAN